MGQILKVGGWNPKIPWIEARRFMDRVRKVHRSCMGSPWIMSTKYRDRVRKVHASCPDISLIVSGI
jgi:hypothetical protein